MCVLVKKYSPPILSSNLATVDRAGSSSPSPLPLVSYTLLRLPIYPPTRLKCTISPIPPSCIQKIIAPTFRPEIEEQGTTCVLYNASSGRNCILLPHIHFEPCFYRPSLLTFYPSPTYPPGSVLRSWYQPENNQWERVCCSDAP